MPMTVSVIITDGKGDELLNVTETGFKYDDLYIPGHPLPSVIKAIAAFQRVRFEKGAAASDV
jgi:hypothetical protein